MAAAGGIRGAGMVESKRKIRYNKQKMGWFPMRAANMGGRMSMRMNRRAVVAIP